MSDFTDSQRRAIEAEGNVLVVAGAGTGKTRTLVERCLARVCDPMEPVSLDNILMVTFTEAAAREMRKRLREQLAKKVDERPGDQWAAEQLALVDTTRISTLHGFCLQLVREHFHELGLDPQMAVLAEEQARLLARDTLGRLVQKHYAGGTAAAEAVQQLILEQGRGWDLPVRELVLQVHHYTQTLRDPNDWFREQLALLQPQRPAHWERWLREGFYEWRKLWLPILRSQPEENSNARRAAERLSGLTDDASPEQIAAVLEQILEADKVWPARKQGAFRKPIEQFFDDAAFLHPLAATDGVDPLAQDWGWVRPQMTALLQLAQEFSQELARAKRELAVVDFHDLEQFALQLLWDRATGGPTDVARRWREKLELVFVDEYQDINEAQDTILRALGREGDAANRFFVGDVKQSIYRFRLANPRIFQKYAEEWNANTDQGAVIALSDNFRSHESILNFINALFTALMRREIGGVEYDEPQRLRPGARAECKNLSLAADPSCRVELHLRMTRGDEAERSEDGQIGLAGRSSAEKEARLTALRLRDLKFQPVQVWDKDARRSRPVEWRDMAVLLRSPRNKVESYAKAFEELDVPLVVARGGFFESLEITDLLSLLQVLDNPLQDLPLLAVLRSPFAGLTLDELAVIRLGQRRGDFWTALRRFHRQTSNSKPQTPDATAAACAETAWRKADLFQRRFASWRQWARQDCLSHCLEAVLDETCYEAWLLAQSRGEQRRANVRRLLTMTRQFDQFQRQGLFRFLKFVEAQLEAELEVEPASVTTENAVQLMSIHQSKGLEFPVVVTADLAKRFNFDDLKERVILDEEFGLCPKVKPPHTARLYPSLPYWLAKRRQKRASLGEELRLLYVALTRACDRLILTGTVSHKTVAEKWTDGVKDGLAPQQILEANSCLDWLGRWLPGATGHRDWTSSGQSALLSWTIYAENDPRLTEGRVPAGESAGAAGAAESIDPTGLASLRRKLDWRYPFAAATAEPAKTSVSALRRRTRDQTDEEAAPLFQVQPRARAAEKLSAVDIGTAHHVFLLMAPLEGVGSLQDLKDEAERLRQAAVLSDDEISALNFDGLLAFWQSELGRKIRAQPPRHIHRELPFTAKMSRADLETARFPVTAGLPDDEFVVVQGYVDLAVVLPMEIWLVDFKTDTVSHREMAEKVKGYEPQLKLYALALSRIYRRPVGESWLHFLAAGETVSLR